MTKFICPNCRKVRNVSPLCTDFVCQCSDGETKDSAPRFEDVPVIGTWVDYSGSGGDTNFLRGIDNKLDGTRYDSVSPKVHELTVRGNIKSTHRTRGKLTFIELENGKIKRSN
jgi:hypothetical protein